MTDPLSSVGLAEPAPREDLRQAAVRLLADHGVTYGSDSGDTVGEAWRLDPVPVVVEEQEWTGLDAALTQRAELLDAVLSDLYGPRLLLRDGTLPAELVLGHPGFVRAVDGLRLPGPRELVLTATDLVRDPSRGWTALSDRAQAPSGAGYAMEDRRVVAQVLAETYRQAPIARIGPFFHALRLALTDAAPGRSEEPRAVLLTSGPHSETAFDQAYLASMLGLPLVEGDDLVVRDGRVWLRGLGDPEPVDVVLRRLDAEYCDPLDLRSDSRLGVPGLVRALRAGSVSIVNPLGSGVLENAGLLAYLPALARVVLGTDLLLGQAPTYWCGREPDLGHVLAHLDRLVLKPVSRVPATTSVLGWTLDDRAREQLAARIAADPGAWVGQEPVGGSHPDRTDGAARAAVLRAFAVAHGGSYHVMAGGLARLAPGSEPLVSSAYGAIAKDVWVLAGGAPAEGAVDDADMRAPEAPAAAPRTPRSGISPRTAENLYWMGRYGERAEGTVRMLRAVVDRWDDFHRMPQTSGGRALAVLLAALDVRMPAGWPPAVPGDDASAAGRSDASGREVTDLGSLLLDRGRPGSVAWSVRRLAEAQSAVRDQMSPDLWLPLATMARTLAAVRRAIPEAAAGTAPEPRAADVRPSLDRLLEALLAVAGIQAEGLVRDAGWRLLDAGRRVERAQHLVASLSSVTRVRSHDVEALVLESVLIAHESVITYRRRHQVRPRVAEVLDLLLADETNPRSLTFQLRRLSDDLAGVPTHAGATEVRDRLLSDVADLLAEANTVAVGAAVTLDGQRHRLAELLDSLRWRLRAISDEISRAHFVHPAPSRSVGDDWGVGVSPQDRPAGPEDDAAEPRG